MLRTTNPQPSLWEAILPDACPGLPAELARVDRLLDAPAFLAPLTAHFDPRIGRPCIPLDTYLRMMFLKFRYRLGYELVCREVADSISWQRFCRIPLGGQVPHPTTLVKLTRRLGEQTVTALNEALLANAAEHKVLRTQRVRADTTVVAANVCYPTDAGLLARAIGKLHTTVGRIQATGAATRTRVRDRRRSARRRAHQLAKSLRARSEQAKRLVLRTTGELADLATQAVGDAARVARNAAATWPAPVTRHAGAWPGASTSWRPRSSAPARSLPRPAPGWPARFPTAPAGWSACTTLTPARSSKDGSASRWSSATRPRSPTTPTGSCSTTRSRSATPPMRRCWRPRSSASRPGPAASPRR
jgi:IS5 family transposase